MRIPCPFCGPRDAAEFSYLGDAAPKRPDTAIASADIEAALYDYVYLRDNPAGLLREYWYHGSGCHGWLVVERDTRTHRIIAASMAQAEPSP
jgi:methylglutamate dehydrogenase subunit B